MPVSQMRMLRSNEVTQLVSAGRGGAGVGGEEKSSVRHFHTLMLSHCLSALSLALPHGKWGLGSLTGD